MSRKQLLIQTSRILSVMPTQYAGLLLHRTYIHVCVCVCGISQFKLYSLLWGSLHLPNNKLPHDLVIKDMTNTEESIVQSLKSQGYEFVSVRVRFLAMDIDEDVGLFPTTAEGDNSELK